MLLDNRNFLGLLCHLHQVFCHGMHGLIDFIQLLLEQLEPLRVAVDLRERHVQRLVEVLIFGDHFCLVLHELVAVLGSLSNSRHHRRSRIIQQQFQLSDQLVRIILRKLLKLGRANLFLLNLGKALQRQRKDLLSARGHGFDQLFFEGEEGDVLGVVADGFWVGVPLTGHLLMRVIVSVGVVLDNLVDLVVVVAFCALVLITVVGLIADAADSVSDGVFHGHDAFVL